MIRHCLHSEIDRKKWDDAIASCDNIYAYSWYLDVVHPGWEALVEDDYQAVMPLTGRMKFGVKYLFQPYFAQQLGVFSKQPSAAEKVNAFLETIPRDYRFAEIRLNESNTLEDSSKGIEYHRNVLLDLNQNYETIRSNYHTNTRRNLTKAESNDLQLVDSVASEQVIALFRDNRGASLSKWGDAEYKVLTQLVNEAQEHDAAFLVGVTDKEMAELFCAAIFMKTDGRITFLFSGLSEEGKQRHAMTFLLDRVIQRYINQPITFDFEGSDDENLARFYLGFGGEEVKYPSYYSNKLSGISNVVLKAWKRINT